MKNLLKLRKRIQEEGVVVLNENTEIAIIDGILIGMISNQWGFDTYECNRPNNFLKVLWFIVQESNK